MPDELDHVQGRSGQPAQAAEDELQLPLEPDHLRLAKIAMATLAACLVKTLDETDQSFKARFLDRLARAYEEYRNNSEADPTHVLEVIHWTGEMLNGWNPVPGRDKPLFDE